MMFDLKKYLDEKRTIIESRLENFLADAKDRRITSAMHHSLMAGGKRLRPILCLSAMEAIGGNTENGIGVACALEMIHTYSLIHDDLPAMDNDDLRRGIPTCHKAFDEATAILAGDALLTFAFEVMAENLTAYRKGLEIIKMIAKASGHNGMIEGQMLDIMSEGRILTLKELESLHTFKTGALIEASVLTGAMLADADKKNLDQLGKYARYIGLAFQVADDILNVEGDPGLMGKAKGSDEELQKATFPSLIGLEESKKYGRHLIESAIGSIADFDEKAEPLRAIAGYIIERKR